MKRRLLLVLVLICLAGGAAAALWLKGGDDASEVPNTATATRGNVANTVLATGSLESSELVSVGARVSGQIETLAVGLGDKVKKGDLIAQIDSEDQKNSVAQEQASLKQIEAQITAQKATITEDEYLVARRKKLNGSNLTSTEDLQSAIAELAVAKADLEALMAQKDEQEIAVSTAQTELERTKIVAPIDGTVVAIVNKQGATVNANTDAPTIVKLANLDQMVVKTEISEADVINVKAGQKASFTLSGAPDMTFDATLRAIEPAPEDIEDDDTIDTDSAIYYNALLDVPNPDGILRIGMTAEVTITRDEADNVVTIPSGALGAETKDGKRMVQVWNPETGTVTPRAVEVGLNTNVTAEITSGLKEGEKVVVSGSAAAAAPAKSSKDRHGPPPMMGF